MSVTARKPDHLVLPIRVRSKLASESGYSARFALAERIADLPYVQIIESAAGASLGATCVYVQRDQRPVRKRSPAFLLCRIDHAGIGLECLSHAERHRVLSRGWGKLEHQRIRLYMPHDEDELEVCWSILYRAYDTIINFPDRVTSAPRAFVDDLPEISYTSLI